jgi:hypothetical protein
MSLYILIIGLFLLVYAFLFWTNGSDGASFDDELNDYIEDQEERISHESDHDSPWHS